MRIIRLRAGAAALAILSANVLVLPFILAHQPGIDFRTVALIMIGGSLLSLASIAWLVWLIVRLAKLQELDRGERQTVILACVLLGQFGMVWSVFHLTGDRGRGKDF